jgi:hypothetical protein
MPALKNNEITKEVFEVHDKLCINAQCTVHIHRCPYRTKGGKGSHRPL